MHIVHEQLSNRVPLSSTIWAKNQSQTAQHTSPSAPSRLKSALNIPIDDMNRRNISENGGDEIYHGLSAITPLPCSDPQRLMPNARLDQSK
jgi:hypothetical protein